MARGATDALIWSIQIRPARPNLKNPTTFASGPFCSCATSSGPRRKRIKESRLRLRVLRATGYLDAQHDPLIREAYELVNIVAAMIRNSTVNEARKRLREPRT